MHVSTSMKYNIIPTTINYAKRMNGLLWYLVIIIILLIWQPGNRFVNSPKLLANDTKFIPEINFVYNHCYAINFSLLLLDTSDTMTCWSETLKMLCRLQVEHEYERDDRSYYSLPNSAPTNKFLVGLLSLDDKKSVTIMEGNV